MTGVEIFRDQDGIGIVVQSDSGFHKFSEDDIQIVEFLFDVLSSDYPDAFKSLKELYGHSVKAKYRMAHRFIRCNFSNYDNRVDIAEGNMKLEFVPCPLRGECQYENVICNPTYHSELSNREVEVMKLICDGLQDRDIADHLFISIHTVNNHRRSIHRKLGTTDKVGILNYAIKHNLK